MLTQMQRKTLELIGQDLIDASEAQRENLEFLLSAYKLANSSFSQRENDPDPSTILMGIQASALGVKTLADWLMVLGEEVGLKYYKAGKDIWTWCITTMDFYGIVLPDLVTPA